MKMRGSCGPRLGDVGQQLAAQELGVGRRDGVEDVAGHSALSARAANVHYIIENVVGAPIRADVILCGTQFGLRITKHRGFECSFPVFALLPPCDHADVYDPWHGPGRTVAEFRAAQNRSRSRGLPFMASLAELVALTEMENGQGLAR